MWRNPADHSSSLLSVIRGVPTKQLDGEREVLCPDIKANYSCFFFKGEGRPGTSYFRYSLLLVCYPIGGALSWVSFWALKCDHLYDGWLCGGSCKLNFELVIWKYEHRWSLWRLGAVMMRGVWCSRR